MKSVNFPILDPQKGWEVVHFAIGSDPKESSQYITSMNRLIEGCAIGFKFVLGCTIKRSCKSTY